MHLSREREINTVRTPKSTSLDRFDSSVYCLIVTI